MPNITLPDGKKLNFKKSVTGSEVAEKISKSLAKQALIMTCLFFQQSLIQLFYFGNLIYFRLVGLCLAFN